MRGGDPGERERAREARLDEAEAARRDRDHREQRRGRVGEQRERRAGQAADRGQRREQGEEVEAEAARGGEQRGSPAFAEHLADAVAFADQLRRADRSRARACGARRLRTACPTRPIADEQRIGGQQDCAERRDRDEAGDAEERGLRRARGRSARPARIVGSVSTGRNKMLAVCSSENAVKPGDRGRGVGAGPAEHAAAATSRRRPRRRGRPGSSRSPASCEVATENHASVRSAIRWSAIALEEAERLAGDDDDEPLRRDARHPGPRTEHLDDARGDDVERDRRDEEHQDPGDAEPALPCAPARPPSRSSSQARPAIEGITSVYHGDDATRTGPEAPCGPAAQ